MHSHKMELGEQKREVLLFVALVAIGLVGVREWVIGPHVGALRAAERYQGSLVARAERSASVDSALRAAHTRLDALAAQHALLSERVFSPAQADEFLCALEAFCMETDCIMGAVNGIDDRQERGLAIEARTATMSLQGAYGNVIRLIEKLQSRPQRVVLESLRMAAARTDATRVECTLVITIYVKHDEEK
jgi:hypothetical protein